MIGRRTRIIALGVILLAAVLIFLVLVLRDEETTSGLLEQCHAIDHFVQVQEYIVSVSPILQDDEKETRILIYENFRDELGCRDNLDPDVIRDAVRPG
jgi:hypothetical protein